VNAGIAYSENPCLSQQLTWAKALSANPSVYANLANPDPALTDPNHWPEGCTTPSPACSEGYGQLAAAYSYGLLAEDNPNSLFWWLDVETANSWDGAPEENLSAVQGDITYLESQGVPSANIGIYSTQSQWTQITGGAQLPVPVWLAGAHAQKTASQYCDLSYSFTGGPVLLVQYFTKGFDADLACSGASGGGSGGGGHGGGGGHAHVTRLTFGR
jgi:hypothetical protein